MVGKFTMGRPLPDGIGEDVTLTLGTAGGPVLQQTLIMAALLARTQEDGALLPFVYREPYDPDDPDRSRPLRTAVLAIIDDHEVGECRGGDYCDETCPGPGRCGTEELEPANIPVRRQVEGRWQTVMITRGEWDRNEGANKPSTQGS